MEEKPNHYQNDAKSAHNTSQRSRRAVPVNTTTPGNSVFEDSPTSWRTVGQRLALGLACSPDQPDDQIDDDDHVER
jgi:hypothetical protein